MSESVCLANSRESLFKLLYNMHDRITVSKREHWPGCTATGDSQLMVLCVCVCMCACEIMIYIIAHNVMQLKDTVSSLYFTNAHTDIHFAHLLQLNPLCYYEYSS